MKTSTQLLLASSLTALLSSTAFANVLHVQTGADDVPGSLRDTVAKAQSGDTVMIDSRLKTLKLTHEILIDKSLTIQSNVMNPAQDRPTVDAQRLDRIFRISHDKINVEIAGLNLVNGVRARKDPNQNGRPSENNDFGGALYVWGSQVQVNIHDVDFIGNSAPNGGAIAAQGPMYPAPQKIVLRNTVFKNNEAEYNGGAIFTMWSFLKIYDSQLSNNNAVYGGAIEPHYGCTNIYNSELTQNHAEIKGGAIDNNGFVKMANSVVQNNVADRSNGGLNAAYILKFQGNVVDKNKAASNDNIGSIILLNSQGQNKIGSLEPSSSSYTTIHLDKSDAVGSLNDPTILNVTSKSRYAFPPCTQED
ncbi:hypothetical protein EZJ49_07035 [Bdellovibrio bacteriovorus]|uniref:hypothetical protein n=1 Tax=Bdellovibrio bacteriovorus TaxID=959 RepID=UPI0021CF170F|nr:hypothetical protein [Bdellovibrio bacteriovorus]UXR66001.1 hypothetical protein EZJ49_07035 [Bdellovibrio bacteriovorus]